ncbi:MAG TPA: hypothetical protein VGF75_02635 [Candidatus Saccharimonadales bacterium]|jgi:hypothetical protein
MSNAAQVKPGNISVKPRKGRYFRRHLRMEQAVRLESSGQYTNNEIAKILGVKLCTLHQMKAQTEYLQKRAELSTGVVVGLENGLRVDEENIRAEIREMLPAALRTLRNAVERGAVNNAPIQDIKLGVEASKEIMDREGTFTKVSKSEIKVKEMPSFSGQEKVEDDLLALLQRAQSEREREETAQDGSTNKVKRSEQTITLEAFVSSGGNEDAQKRMKEFIKLEDFDSHTVN